MWARSPGGGIDRPQFVKSRIDSGWNNRREFASTPSSRGVSRDHRIAARKEEKDRGIPTRYSRVSIGLEEAEDLIADFKQAIEKCR